MVEAVLRQGGIAPLEGYLMTCTACLQDSWSDLQLFLVLNVAILALGVTVKYCFVDSLSGEELKPSLWRDFYQVRSLDVSADILQKSWGSLCRPLFHTPTSSLAKISSPVRLTCLVEMHSCFQSSKGVPRVRSMRWSMSTLHAAEQVAVLAFGENFPDGSSQGASQAFSLAIAAAGLVSFALVLALVEQVVLEIVEENVKRGSPIFTSGHVRAHPPSTETGAGADRACVSADMNGMNGRDRMHDHMVCAETARHCPFPRCNHL